MEAQPTIQTLAGEYYLEAVMETASGFRLNEDSTFEFFFSYGALDRTAKGRWHREADHIIFSSAKGNGGFLLSRSGVKSTGKTTIKIDDANPFLRSSVYVILYSGGQRSEAITDKNGMAIFPKQQADSIQLLLEFCPDKFFSFSNPQPSHDYFEFKFEKDIMEVFFNNLSLRIKPGELEGRHPLLKEGIYHFRKSNR